MSGVVIDVTGLVKVFRVPSLRRDTVREHALDLFRARPEEELRVLDGVDLRVRAGETLGVMGRNGSGKSTLLKVLAGIYVPNAGSVRVAAPVTPILELGVGWNPELDAVDNVELLGSVLGLTPKECRHALDSVLEFAGLQRFARLELRHFSSGMSARLAYAVAFHAVRDILILDEIFAVGDAEFQARCERRLRELQERGHTILLVSHAPGTIAEFCGRAILLEGGRVALTDRADVVADAYSRLLAGGSLPFPAPAPEKAAAPAVRADSAGPPRVSVIVTCYDLGAWVEEAIDSIFAQTVPDFEILVTDDGSTDPHTRRVLDALERPRTRVFRTTHRGLAGARNFLIEQARGEFLCALDADDLLAPTYFENALAAFERDPGLTFVSCWLEAFGTESWVWRQTRCDLAALLEECTVLTAALVRREAVTSVGGYDPRMPFPGNEDWDLWLSLVAAGHRGTILPEVLFHYRRRPGSMSTECTRGEAHLSAVRYLTAKHAAAYDAHLASVVAAQARRLGTLVEHDRALDELVEQRRDLLRFREHEAARLAARADAAVESGGTETETDRLRVALSVAAAEVEALRGSLSWRLTAPLRRVHAKIRGLS